MKLENVYTPLVMVILLMICVPASTSGMGVMLEEVDWMTVGNEVEFYLRFRNPDPETSDVVTGELLAQRAFGIFLYDQEVSIGTFDIPPLEPESFFDVFFTIPLDVLPPGPEERLPTNGMAPPLGRMLMAQPDCCPPDDHWDGNVDVIWSGPGGSGQVFKHIGTIQVCPGLGNSYIHVVADVCAGNVSWVVTGICTGFSATLVNEDFTPAPNPFVTPWSGWICISADASVTDGTVCCFSFDFTCAGPSTSTASIDLCATACTCGPSAVECTRWGAIKSLYK